MMTMEGKPPLRADPPEGTRGAEAPSGEKACYSVRDPAGDGGFLLPLDGTARSPYNKDTILSGPPPQGSLGARGKPSDGRGAPEHRAHGREEAPARKAAPSGGGLGRGNGRRGDPPFLSPLDGDRKARYHILSGKVDRLPGSEGSSLGCGCGNSALPAKHSATPP